MAIGNDQILLRQRGLHALHRDTDEGRDPTFLHAGEVFVTRVVPAALTDGPTTGYGVRRPRLKSIIAGNSALGLLHECL